MSIWYALCEATHLEFLHMTFMKNALLAVLILAPLFEAALWCACSRKAT